jgi:hypothetical protein
VKTNTKGKIPRIVSADAIRKGGGNPDQRCLLRRKLGERVSQVATRNESFHRAGGGIKTMPMMHHPLIRGAYRSGPNFEGAVLPTADADLPAMKKARDEYSVLAPAH